MVDLKKFAKGALLGLLSDPQVLYDTMASVIEASIEAIPMDALLEHLDKNTPPDQLFSMIPAEYLNRILSALGDVDDETLQRIRGFAVRYINLKNVLLFLKQNNIELYTIFINHPNGKTFLNNFITYILQNLDTILRRRFQK